MGGDCYQPVSCMVTPDEIHDLGNGIAIGSVTYNGKTIVFDIKSGGYCGDSIEGVKKDFAEAPVEVVQEQIANAIKQGKAAILVDPEIFFK